MFSFLCISFENELKISTNRNFLTLGKDAYLTHSILQYFEKPTLKNPQKTPETLNGGNSKTRMNLESRLRFSESSFNFPQNSIILSVPIIAPKWVHDGRLCPLQLPAPLPVVKRLKWLSKL